MSKGKAKAHVTTAPVVAAPAAAPTEVRAELTIYHAAALAFDLRRQLEAGSNLELDLAGVTELDSAGLQVLLVAEREARARGLSLRLHRPSRVVMDVLETLHLTQRLTLVEDLQEKFEERP
jgi:anti-anti-sigma factor